MIPIDFRTIFFNYLLTNIVSLIVMFILWRQSRNRFDGTFYLLIDFLLQVFCILFIFLRGHIPDFVSIDVANLFAVSGAVLGFIGLEYFIGKHSNQIHNYLLIAVFFSIHTWFAFVEPDLEIRNLNVAVAALVICSQCAWLLLKRVPRNLRRFTLNVGIVFVLFCSINVIRIIEFFITKNTATDYFKAGDFETFVIISYQLLFILLTFSLALMINKRLLNQIVTQEEKFSKAFHSVPYAIIITRLSDGRFLEVNDGFELITNFSAAEVIGKTTLELNLWVSDEDRELLVNALVEKEKANEFEFDFHKKTGELFTGLISSELITINNEKCILSVINDITEHKQAEERIVESEAKFRELFIQMSEGFALHEVIYDAAHKAIDYKIIDINPAFEKQVGIFAEKATGALASELYGVSPAPYLEIYAQVAETGDPQTLQSYFQPLDRHFEISVFSPNPGFFATIFSDITDRSQAEEQLRSSERNFRLLFENSPLGIYIANVDGTIVDGNQALLNILGSPSLEQTKQINVLKFPPLIENGYADQFLKCVLENEVLISEMPYTTKWGKQSYLSTYLVPLANLSGKVERVYTLMEDITKRKQAEEALRESNATKDKFFSIIAHDLRSPFATLVGFSELMADENSRFSVDEYRQYSKALHKTASSTFDLLENLLEWSRLQRGIIPYDPRLIEFKEFFEIFDMSINEMARKKMVKIKVDIAQGLKTFADENMLQSVVRNLVTNAIKFTKPGGIVKVVARTDKSGEVLFSVNDTGIGMDADLINNLFHIETNVSRPGTDGEPSTGLGLFLCKEFVEKHGGRIWAESEVGKGSTFYFTIPKR